MTEINIDGEIKQISMDIEKFKRLIQTLQDSKIRGMELTSKYTLVRMSMQEKPVASFTIDDLVQLINCSDPMHTVYHAIVFHSDDFVLAMDIVNNNREWEHVEKKGRKRGRNPNK